MIIPDSKKTFGEVPEDFKRFVINASYQEEPPIKKKLSVGLVLAFVLLLIALGAAAAVILSGKEFAGEVLAPMSVENASARWTPGELDEILRIASENGIALPDDVLLRLQQEDGTYKEELMRVFVKLDLGFYPATWPIEDQAWYDALLVECGLLDVQTRFVPEGGEISLDQALEIAVANIKDHFGDPVDVTDESIYRRFVEYRQMMNGGDVIPRKWYIGYEALLPTQNSYHLTIDTDGTVEELRCEPGISSVENPASANQTLNSDEAALRYEDMLRLDSKHVSATPLKNGDILLVGRAGADADTTDAWAARINPIGERLWEVQNAEGWEFKEAVEMSDGSFLLAMSPKKGEYFTLALVTLDTNGQMLNGPVTLDVQGFAYKGKDCLIVCKRYDTDSRTPPNTLLAVNGKGEALWEHTYDELQGRIGFHPYPAVDGYILFGMEEDPSDETQRGAWGMMAKLDDQGNLLWKRLMERYPNTAISYILETDDGGMFGAGWNTRRGEDDAEEYEMSDFVVRFDAEGNVLWFRYYPELEPADENHMSLSFENLLPASNGGVLVIASDSWPRSSDLGLRFIHLDGDGNVLADWRQKLSIDKFRFDGSHQSGAFTAGTQNYLIYHDWAEADTTYITSFGWQAPESFQVADGYPSANQALDYFQVLDYYRDTYGIHQFAWSQEIWMAYQCDMERVADKGRHTRALLRQQYGEPDARSIPMDKAAEAAINAIVEEDMITKAEIDTEYTAHALYLLGTSQPVWKIVLVKMFQSGPYIFELYHAEVNAYTGDVQNIGHYHPGTPSTNTGDIFDAYVLQEVLQQVDQGEQPNNG